MRLTTAMLGLLAAAVAAGPDLKITQYSTCPDPPHRMVMTIEADGKASLYVTHGFGPGSGDSSVRKEKQLTQKEMKTLAAAVRKYDFYSLPDDVYPKPPELSGPDSCDHRMEIALGGKTKEVHYEDLHLPKKLDRLLRAIDKIVNREPWS